MEEALRRAGLDRRPFVQGDVWWVNDANVFLPTTLSGNRTVHPERPVVIVDGPARCGDASLQFIQVAPTSHLVRSASRYHVVLQPGQANLPSETVVLLDLIQPIPRTAFTRRCGSLLEAEFASLAAILLDNLGLLPEEETA